MLQPHLNLSLPFDGPTDDSDYWRELIPSLTIDPDVAPSTAWVDPLPAVDAAARASLATDGYFVAENLLPAVVYEPLAAGVASLHNRFLAPQAIWMYDEAFSLFAGIGALLKHVLAGQLSFNLLGYDAFYVPPSSEATGLGPHRDNSGFDPGIEAGEPSIINIWVALTDATVTNGCIHLVPGSRDPGYQQRASGKSEASFQDVQALPVPAGSILGWTSHVLHWGGRSSATAANPRLSMALYLQTERSVAPGPIQSLTEGVPFEHRLHWLSRSP